jgi:alkaline phosphatase D
MISIVACQSVSSKPDEAPLASQSSPSLLKSKDQWQDLCAKENVEVYCWFLDNSKLKTQDFKARVPVMQGATSSTATQVVMTVGKAQSLLHIYLYDRALQQVFQPSKRKVAQREFSEFKNIQVYFDNLKNKTTYELVIADEDGHLIDEREISTLDETDQKMKFAVISCSDDNFKSEEVDKIWQELNDTQLPVIFAIGDNVYADKKNGQVINPMTEEILWQRHVDTRQTLNIFKMHRLTPFISVWDDHDFGLNDGTRTFPLRDKSLQTFKDFYAQENIPNVFENGPGVSSQFVFAGQKFILMDARYFRSVNKPTAAWDKLGDALKNYTKAPVLEDIAADETHFGAEGEAWLYQNLDKDDQPTWLISGDQFFGAYHIFESYEGSHPTSFKSFTDKLKTTKSHVVFVSGDRHLSEVMEIEKAVLDYPTYEITSSPMHSTVTDKGWEVFKNPRQILGHSGLYNYTLIESEVQNKVMNFKLMDLSSDHKSLYEKSLSIQ